MTRIAINGFGRIGKMVLRSIMARNLPVEVVAINDLSGAMTAAHLFEYDSTYGKFHGTVSYDDNNITVNNKTIKVLSSRDPATLPWKDLDIDIVLECTGVFTAKEQASLHLQAGAKRVIISAPAKNEVDATLVLGVNEHIFDKTKHFIISNASCTTNCLAPVAKVLHDKFGIEHGLMNTIHSYTADQNLVDGPHKDLRRARSAGESIVPTTTGAAKAIGLVIPDLKGKLDGLALRVPTPTVSVVDLTFVSKQELSIMAINEALKEASNNTLKGILGIEEKPLVSIDYRQDSRSSIVDTALTMVIGKNLAKVVAWYDNEWGYASRLADLAVFVSK